MDPWDGWGADRAALRPCAVLFAGIWAQLTLMHWAGGFRRKAMWGPVVATPLFVLAAVVGIVDRSGSLGWVLAALLGLGVVEGLVGLFLHLRGMVAQVGGLTVRNLLVGPPPLLPLAYTLVGVLGVGALMWNA